MTVVLNGETGHILAMVEHRSTAALAGFFREQTPGWRRGVKVVVTDGSRAYKSAIDTWIPNARHVLDRFHVVRWFTAGLTAVRRDIQRRPDGTLPAFDPDVFRARFALLRRGDQLSDAQAAHIDKLLADHPRLQVAWDALQELYGLYLAEDYDGALAALGRFGDLYATGKLPEFRKVVRHRHRLGRRNPGLASVRATIQRRLEGANNLLQVLRRVAHGFTNPNNYAARGLLLI